MTTRRRLPPTVRRQQLLDVGAALFAVRSYDQVLMDDVAGEAGVSRALLYRHFPSKQALFAAVYQRAAERLLAGTVLDTTKALPEQLAAGLDAHLDYFVDNRLTVLTANRTLAGDPVIQAIISDELAVLRDRLLEVIVVDERLRETVSAVLMSWLVFVRVLCVEWLTRPTCSRTELRELCSGALLGALAALPR